MLGNMKIGVCGTGIFARDSHLPAIQKAGGITVEACYNRTRSKAEAFAKLAGANVKVYDTLDELLGDKSVDAVDVLVPVDQNLDVVKATLKSGKPLCFEKPISHSLEDGRKIVEMCAQSDTPVMILENWIYHNATKKLAELLPKIGKVITFSYQHTGPFKRNKFHETPWRQDPKHIGGFLSDAGVHEIALLTETLGEITSASAHTAQVQEISGTVDVVNASLKMDSGAFGSYLYSTSLGACEPQIGFQIFGENGSIVLRDCTASNSATITLREGKGADHIQETVVELAPNDIDGLVEEFKNFNAAVRAKDKSLIKATPQKGFHHYASIVAMIESANKNGQVVAVEKI